MEYTIVKSINNNNVQLLCPVIIMPSQLHRPTLGSLPEEGGLRQLLLSQVLPFACLFVFGVSQSSCLGFLCSWQIQNFANSMCASQTLFLAHVDLYSIIIIIRLNHWFIRRHCIRYKSCCYLIFCILIIRVWIAQYFLSCCTFLLILVAINKPLICLSLSHLSFSGDAFDSC